MAKLFCQKCGGPVEFDLNEFKRAGISTANCPHCNQQMQLFEPQVPPTLASPPSQKVSNSSMVSLFALIVFFGWSALIAIWGVGTFFGWVKGGLFSQTHSDAEQTGAFFGVIISLAILFGVWLLGAVPSFLFWFIFKKK